MEASSIVEKAEVDDVTDAAFAVKPARVSKGAVHHNDVAPGRAQRVLVRRETARPQARRSCAGSAWGPPRRSLYGGGSSRCGSSGQSSASSGSWRRICGSQGGPCRSSGGRCSSRPRISGSQRRCGTSTSPRATLKSRMRSARGAGDRDGGSGAHALVRSAGQRLAASRIRLAPDAG